MIVRKCEVIPFECVARGYLAGSGWAEYKKSGTVCGIRLPQGLREADKLPEPIFTPATKAETGHDENISFERMAAALPAGEAETLRDLTLSLYRRASDYSATRGLILADTKLEFGRLDGPDRLDRRGIHARLVALLGRVGCTRRAGARPPSTSSSSATGSTRPAGTSARPRRDCPRASSARRARSTSTPTSGSRTRCRST